MIPSSDDTGGPTCISSKVTRKPFALRERHDLGKHQLWASMDYVNPMQVSSLIGHTGMVNILIESFHIEAVYPVRSKSCELQLDALRDRVKNVITLSPCSLPAFLKTDNTLEYTGCATANYCVEEEVVQDLSTSYCSKQNGRIERVNRVIVEMTRSMLSGCGLPRSFWADAVVYSAYVRNRCPTKALDNASPMEKLLRHKPDVTNLFVFLVAWFKYLVQEESVKSSTQGLRQVYLLVTDSELRTS